MKILKSFFLLLLITLLTSCSSNDSDIALDISNITLKISHIKLTEATIMYNGNFTGNTSRILYKEKSSTDDYQSFNLGGNIAKLTNLQKATEYEVVFEASNNSSSVQSKPYYFSTKAVNFDYSKFYTFSESGEIKSPFLIFSHLNKQHVIHAEGLSDYNNVKVFLVNEQKTDSLEINSFVESDSLTFTIPNDYLSQTPRESVKKAWVGIKINDSYEYLLNEYGWGNVNSNPNYSPEDDSNEAYLKLKIFNDKPFIESVNMTTGSSSTCPNYTRLNFSGGFLTDINHYYWKPQRAELVIFDLNGNLYDTYINNFDNNSIQCNGGFDLFLKAGSVFSSEDDLPNYHHLRSAHVNISNLPVGNYSAKIVFSFENVLEGVETNTIEFEKM